MKLNQRLFFESVKKSLTQVGFEPTTFGLLERRFTSWATESTPWPTAERGWAGKRAVRACWMCDAGVGPWYRALWFFARLKVEVNHFFVFNTKFLLFFFMVLQNLKLSSMSCVWRFAKIILRKCDWQIYESNFNRFACSWLVLAALKTKITLLPYWALVFEASAFQPERTLVSPSNL